jgi:hypothetical protein
MKRWSLVAAVTAAILVSVGCATLEERERALIFQPSDRAWGGSAALAEGMDDVWIEFDSKVGDAPVKLHGLWRPA